MPGTTLASEQDTGVDLRRLQELGRDVLVTALNSVNGAKTVVLDPSLAGPLDLLTEASLFTQHGVDKLFWLESGDLSVTTANVIYLCRPKIKWIKLVAGQVKRLLRDGQRHAFLLLLVPKTSALVTRILEEEGVLGDVSVLPLNIEFIPLEDDVISLENERAFADIWVDGDETAIYHSAQALMTFQKTYGLIPRIMGKGDCASRICDLMTRLLPQAQAEASSEQLTTLSVDVDSLIILDRRIDMLTPMLTQLTYEGLIDEFIGVEHGRVELPASIVDSQETQQGTSSTTTPASLAKEKKKKYALNASKDPLFAELRDRNFSSVGRELNAMARRLDEDVKNRKNLKTTAELKLFVGKLGGLTTLRIHTGLSEMLVQMTTTEQFNKSLEIQQNLLISYDSSAQIAAIEVLIAQKVKIQHVLRLLCLASVTTGGIKSKTLENIKRDILQTYGYHYLPVILALSSPSLALLLSNPLPASAPPSMGSSRIPFASLRKSLRLVIDEFEDVEEPNDIDYVFSGYAPLSVRLVQLVTQGPGEFKVKVTGSSKTTGSLGKGKGSPVTAGIEKHPIIPIKGWKGSEDILAELPGKTFDVQQRGHQGNGRIIAPVDALHRIPERSRTTVVFFLGGCTYAEIAALRFISKQIPGRRFVIATTSIISGRGLIDSLASSRSAEGFSS